MDAAGPELLGRLFDDHAPALALYARQWCEAPEDVVQEAFVRLACQRSVPDRVVPWLFRVVRNGAISASRGERRRRGREARASSPEAWFAPTGDPIDAAHASRLVAGLDGDLREAVVARVWGGLSFDEIAALHGCSVATAHRRYHAGLARLREQIS
ncbi:RNA polymerase sigma factor [Tundrisphaera sp. TA3]|uniref:RNA polymerase sigma factor n=1 Tax=Tundrisphaera sp. TA3 TaxID=3435775 RepID=UPI003EBF9DD5